MTVPSRRPEGVSKMAVSLLNDPLASPATRISLFEMASPSKIVSLPISVKGGGGSGFLLKKNPMRFLQLTILARERAHAAQLSQRSLQARTTATRIITGLMKRDPFVSTSFVPIQPPMNCPSAMAIPGMKWTAPL